MSHPSHSLIRTNAWPVVLDASQSFAWEQTSSTCEDQLQVGIP